MGQSYRQLSLDERIEIARRYEAGWSLRRIGAAIGRSHATVSRELARNSRRTKSWPGGYAPVRAQELARDAGRTVISHESIYRFVYHRSAQKDYWHRLLPRAKSRRGRYARRGGSPADFIRQRRPIAERPSEASGRKQPGHWEADYMLFTAYGHNVLVLHERTTRFTMLDRPPHRKAAMTAQRIACQLAAAPRHMRRSVSFDNGIEFAEHHRLHANVGVETFFCDVRSPWQKGGVENTIGRLRRLLPRKTNLDTLSPTQLQEYARRLNETPRKCLDFLTPAEAFLHASTGALQT